MRPGEILLPGRPFRLPQAQVIVLALRQREGDAAQLHVALADRIGEMIVRQAAEVDRHEQRRLGQRLRRHGPQPVALHQLHGNRSLRSFRAR